MLGQQFGGRLECDARFADAAHAGDRDEPVVGHETRDVLQFLVATHERRELDREIRRERAERTQWREFAVGSLDELEHPLGLREVVASGQ